MKTSVYKLFIESLGLSKEFEEFRENHRKEYNRENTKRYYQIPENWERKKLLKRQNYNRTESVINRKRQKYEELKKEFGD